MIAFSFKNVPSQKGNGMLHQVLAITILALFGSIARAETPESSDTEKSSAAQNKNAVTGKKKAPKAIRGGALPNKNPAVGALETTLGPVASDDGIDGSTATNRALSDAPIWLYGLPMEATPGDIFESSLAKINLAYFHDKQRIKSSIAGITSKVAAKTSLIATRLSYGSVISSRKIFINVDGSIVRGQVDYETQLLTSGGTSKTTFTSGADVPEIGASVALQANSGFWVGTRSAWTRDFTKIESKTGSETQKFTSKAEYATQIVGIEFRGYPGHFGLEYSLQNKGDNLTTKWSAPIRLAISDKLFIGGSLSSETEKDFSSTDKTSTTYHLLEAGVQGAASAFIVQFEYDLEKSGVDSNVRTGKTKTGTLIANFGAKKGLRFGIATSYKLDTKQDLGAPDAKMEGGSIQFQVVRAN